MTKPAFGALLLFVTALAAVSIQVYRATEGHIGYALDDAYIHMSIARNVAEHGVWGINTDAFASASSSPLWTALLAAAFWLVGVRETLPLLLNLAAAVALIVVLGRLLKAQLLTGQAAFATLAAVVLFAPMVPMVWIGMEHSLNNLIVVLLAWSCLELVSPGAQGRAWVLYVLAGLACATRIEGLFVVGGCAVALWSARRRWLAVGACAAGLAPVLLLGVWNLAHGWFFLPASVMMKQTVLPPPDATWLGTLVWSVRHAYPPAVFVAMLVFAGILLAQSAVASRTLHAQPLLTITVVTSLLHLGLARFGFLYRYESYAMVLGVLAIGVALQQYADRIARLVRLVSARDAVLAAVMLAVVAGSERTLQSNVVLINTAGHIYRQQRQMGRFVARYYGADAVALNDIGAVSFYSDARVYDLAGLASLEAAVARREGTFDTRYINNWLAQGQVPIAIVYDFWYPQERRFYDRWQRVGRWITDDQDELTEGAVTFYARTAEEATRLRRHLDDFTTTLPRATVVEPAAGSVQASHREATVRE